MQMRRRVVFTLVAVLAVILATTLLVSQRHVRRATPPAASPSATIGPSTAPSATASATASPTPSQPGPHPTVTPLPGPFEIPAQLRGKDVEYIPTSRPIVALTFDAGANADGLPSILATLAIERISATFFLTGDFASRYPAAVRSIVAAGHRLGNHTVTHPYCTSLSEAAIAQQITGAEAQVRAAGGTSTRPLFRFPYGDRDRRTITAVNNTGYVAVRWTVDSKGWQGTSGGMSVRAVVDRVVGAARPGEIVLMHIGSNPDDHTMLDAQALPTVIAQLRGRGYGFETLDALLT
jgi:peptidoglycan/xylan/chitin deacetylase (PgdA/CDA1 family)